MLDKALEWFDRISKTPLKNRIFVLMLFIVFLLVATNITTWIHLTNKEKYIGKLANIRYFELTDDGIPRFPVMIGIHEDR